MFNKRYKKIIKSIESRMSEYKEGYLYWKNRGDDDTATRFLLKYVALENILTEIKS
jgi:hypothetical protein